MKPTPQKIFELRNRLHMTQAEFGEAVKYSARTVIRWEKGECDVSPHAKRSIKLLAIENKISIDV